MSKDGRIEGDLDLLRRRFDHVTSLAGIAAIGLDAFQSAPGQTFTWFGADDEFYWETNRFALSALPDLAAAAAAAVHALPRLVKLRKDGTGFMRPGAGPRASLAKSGAFEVVLKAHAGDAEQPRFELLAFQGGQPQSFFEAHPAWLAALGAGIADAARASRRHGRE